MFFNHKSQFCLYFQIVSIFFCFLLYIVVNYCFISIDITFFRFGKQYKNIEETTEGYGHCEDQRRKVDLDSPIW